MPLDFIHGISKFSNDLVSTPAGKSNHNNDGSIGATIKVVIDVTISGELQDGTPATVSSTRWYFNPGLFIQSGAKYTSTGNVAYAVEIPGGTTSGTFQMPLFTGGPYVDSNRNETCELTVIDETTAQIGFTFRLTMDLGDFVRGNLVSNHDRFLNNHLSAPTELLNTHKCVYNEPDRLLGYRLTIEDGFGVQLLKHGSAAYRSRYYASGLPVTSGIKPDPAEMSPGYEFKMYRGGVEVTDFSPWEKTQVEFKWDAGGVATIENGVRVYLIDQSKNVNVDGFLADYGSNGLYLTTTVGTGLIGEHIYGPVDAVATESGKYVLRFWVNNDLNDASWQRYAIIVVLRGYTSHLPDDTYTNSFIESDISARGLPTSIELDADDFTGTIINYNDDPATDNVKTTVVDQHECRVTVNTGTYDAAAASSLFATTWEQDMRRIEIDVIEEDTSVVLWTSFHVKSGGSWQGAFPSINNPRETVLGGGLVRYSMELPMHMPNLGGTPDFSGRKIKHRWRFVCDYPAFDWQVHYQYDQRADVRGFGNFAEVIESITLFDYDSGLPLQSLCGSDKVLVKVQLDTGQMSGLDWNLRVYWQLEPYGMQEALERRSQNNLSIEAEAYPSATNMLQLSNGEVLNVPAEFDGGGSAQFVFDHSLIGGGEKVRLYIIAEPTA